MPRTTRWILAIAAGAVLAVSVTSAKDKDIVYFSNGTAMPVEAHRIENGMVHVSLGDDSTMAFPEYMVESIDSEGQGKVKHRESEAGSKMLATKEAPLPAKGVVDMRSQGLKSNPHATAAGRVEKDDKGVPVYRPYAGGAAQNKRQFGAAGSQRVRNHQSAMGVGSARNGARQSIGSRSPRGRADSKPVIVGFEQNPGKRRRGSGNTGGTGSSGDSGSTDNSGSSGESGDD